MTTPSEPTLYPNGAARPRPRTGSPAHHFRTPAYIQGHTGVGRRALRCSFPTPRRWPTAAMACPANRCTASACARPTCGPTTPAIPADTLLVDVYQHWLEPA